MRSNQFLLLHTIFWTGLLGLSSCKADKKITITANRTEMTAQWDNMPSEKANEVFAPYKAKVDSIMDPVIGESAMDMTAKRPESLLSNLVADVLRNSTIPYIQRPADVAIINVGGLRNSLSKGDISYRSIYEILPFENSLCILSLKGSDVKELMKDIIKVGGEGLSNVQMTVNKDMDIVDVKINNQPINDDQLYTIATVDYLAEGNDRMTAFKRAEKRMCVEEATIRDIFLEYVKAEAAQGRALTSKMEGRVTILDK
ncbi:5'-nucleotidase C-terminal domain-containing protein [Bacteroides sp. 51]|uniref:5'-nucleotidase C-terminal domain-containing protein n=1 Tax=Bacteroides sp. 51 TaxID=2302938 RepID=UPI0013D87E3A|nr:5'-nucleotidase [Bacteroides sp. 51]NDV84415.1 5'-nucleotidase [Bacteroides sp. 51]